LINVGVQFSRAGQRQSSCKFANRAIETAVQALREPDAAQRELKSTVGFADDYQECGPSKVLAAVTLRSDPAYVPPSGKCTAPETYYPMRPPGRSEASIVPDEISAITTRLNVRPQSFASDIGQNAIAWARDGLYPDMIETDVSPERPARFFSKEGRGYRILPELRNVVVFTVQDVLASPRFSRLDLVSRWNLVIYQRPEAQAKIIALFHFALRGGGVLLLGSPETLGKVDDVFAVVSKPADSLCGSVVAGRARSVSR
jgi:hypothetical protein